jgi:hypothetical protein
MGLTKLWSELTVLQVELAESWTGATPLECQVLEPAN